MMPPTACTTGDGRPVQARGLCARCYQRERRGSTREHLSPGEGVAVQFRTSKALRLAVLSRADAEGLTEREAWEQAGQTWADGG